MTPDCIICDQKTWEIRDVKNKEGFYFCTACDFIFRDRNVLLTETEEMQRYRLHDCSGQDRGYVKMFRDFLNIAVLPFTGEIVGKRALDYGCGPGPEPVLHRMLSQLGFVVDKYDLYFFPEAAYEKKKYDLITATELAEHLKNPLETFENLSKRLNKNGILAMMTRFHPMKQDREADRAAFLEWWYRRDRTHISFFSPKTMRYLAGQANLTPLLIDESKIAVFKAT